MTWRSKVVWSEGLFLRPQHFQQETRYLEHFVELRSGYLRPYAWGFTELSLDADMLRIGNEGIRWDTPAIWNFEEYPRYFEF